MGQDAYPRWIVARGGHPADPTHAMDRFVLSLARRRRPRVCFVPTASGDAPAYLARFYRIMSRLDCEPSDLTLFERTVADIPRFVAEQDVIYVGGGNTASLLAVWRAHGLDRALRDAWTAGVVLTGVSAGMNCWFSASVTDSFDVTTLAPLSDGLGLLAGSCCPHFDGEPQRRPTYHRCVGAGLLADGWAADDAAGLVFSGTELAEVVTSAPKATAYRVRADGAGGVSEERLAARYLGD